MKSNLLILQISSTLSLSGIEFIQPALLSVITFTILCYVFGLLVSCSMLSLLSDTELFCLMKTYIFVHAA